MKIYTKSGDAGETSLASGKRVWKHDIRVSLYGRADELNSQLGLAVSFLPDSLRVYKEELQGIQSLLFELASELADWQGLSEDGSLGAKDIRELESAIDRMEAELPALKSFILPGGHAAASALHVARTCCRHLERNLVAAAQQAKPSLAGVQQDGHPPNQEGTEEENQAGKPSTSLNPNSLFRPAILKYINRLSDYLFVLARYVNFKSGYPDTKWKSRNR